MNVARIVRSALSVFAISLALASGMAIAPLAAQQPAPSQTLLPGKGAALTMARCAICHDITHVTRSRLTRDEWDDNIKVMIARGMPIELDEIPVIVDYLSTYYNRDAPPPPAGAAAEKSAPAPASVERSMSDNGCMACHTVDKRLVGPSFREVAERYKGDGSAAGPLANKIKRGGSGVWGQVPMPPHPQIADADIERVVAWILQQ